MIWTLAYIGSIAFVNWGFSSFPGWEWFWSLVVGFVFIFRDLSQRAIGHKVLLAMLAAAALSYLTSNPFVATASVAAFLVSETADWLVYTVTKRPMRDRVLLSSAVSTPLDSIVFLVLIGMLTRQLVVLQVASKMAAAVFVWLLLRWRFA